MAGQNSVNTLNPAVDLTVRVYDQFYEFDIEVDANTYDTVYGYLKSVFGSTKSAQDFTVTLFRVAQETGVPVLTLLEQIQGQDSITLTATIAYYLNGLRSPATLYGINGTVTPNYYTARNVLP